MNARAAVVKEDPACPYCGKPVFLYIENGGGRGSGMASWAADCTCRSIAKDVYGKPIPVQVTNCLSNDGTRRSAVSTFKRWAREVAGK